MNAENGLYYIIKQQTFSTLIMINIFEQQMSIIRMFMWHWRLESWWCWTFIFTIKGI